MTFIGHDGRVYRCYVVSARREKHWLGCSHLRPKDAIAHTSGSYVSPVRHPGPAAIDLAGDKDTPRSRGAGGRSEASERAVSAVSPIGAMSADGSPTVGPHPVGDHQLGQ